MNVWQRVSLCTVIALLAVLPAAQALGTTVSGRASTELEWYDDAQGDTAVPAYQYLMLNIGDIAGQGYDFRLYGRLAEDLANEVDIDSRLYYAYFEKRGLFLDGLDARLGRQFISTTAGASIMDGLYLDYDGLPFVDFKLFGGGDVKYYAGYDVEDVVWGAEVGTHLFDSLDLGLSYLQKWDDNELSKELIGFDAEYAFANMFNVYSELQIDYLSDSISYFLAGAKYYQDPRWSVRSEYLYSLPVFSSTSIYSVFAVAEYQEVMFEGDYKIMPGLRTFGRYSLEIYDEFDNAHVFDLGLEKIRTTSRWSGYLVGTYRADEDGQDLGGFKLYGDYMFGDYLRTGLGIHLDVLERRLEETDETTSSRLWADATYYFNRKINVQGKVERIESDLWDNYYRGRVRLNVLF